MKSLRLQSTRVVALLITVAFLASLNQLHRFHNDVLLTEVPKSNPYLLLLGVPLVALIWVLRATVQKQYFDSALGKVSRSRFPEEERRAQRALTFCKWYVDVPFYLGTMLLSFYILRGEKNLPSWMGGSGSCDQNYKSFFTRSEQAGLIDSLYILQLSQHFYSFAKHVLEPSPDGLRKYNEYLLHHSMAFLLILLSYLANFQLVGVMVLYIHDSSDFLLIIGRYYLDQESVPRWLVTTTTVLGFVSWVYYRLVCFPLCAILSGVRVYLSEENMLTERAGMEVLRLAAGVLLGMMGVLFGMHLFWTYFIVTTFTRYTIKKKIDVSYD